MLRYLINFLYPPRCAACDVRMSIDSLQRVCKACLARIERVPEPMCQICGIPLEPAQYEVSQRCRPCADSPPHFRRARAVARYRPGLSEESQVVPSMIRRHKYGLDQSLSRALAQCLEAAMPLNGHDYDLIIPVPLHHNRLRWRGFNQAALLAAAVANKTGCRLDVAALARVRATAPQTSYDSRQRRLNVRGSFAVKHPRRIADRRVLLVDDVMTTGATANECARTLLEAGARMVDVLTMARAV